MSAQSRPSCNISAFDQHLRAPFSCAPQGHPLPGHILYPLCKQLSGRLAWMIQLTMDTVSGSALRQQQHSVGWKTLSSKLWGGGVATPTNYTLSSLCTAGKCLPGTGSRISLVASCLCSVHLNCIVHNYF